jgi:L-ribulose-5-phosphate 4-epimerase
VPVTDVMQPPEIESGYEWNTGQAIVRRFAEMDPLAKPGVLVTGHAPFCWGVTPAEAVHIAVVLEEIASLAYHALTINPAATGLSDTLRDKHFLRKHGPKAYYGQK